MKPLLGTFTIKWTIRLRCPWTDLKCSRSSYISQINFSLSSACRRQSVSHFNRHFCIVFLRRCRRRRAKTKPISLHIIIYIAYKFQGSQWQNFLIKSQQQQSRLYLVYLIPIQLYAHQISIKYLLFHLILPRFWFSSFCVFSFIFPTWNGKLVPIGSR